MLGLLRKRWLLLTVLVPVTAWVLDKVGAAIQQRRGETNVTRALRWPRAVRQQAA
jgi:hypothetical protein